MIDSFAPAHLKLVRFPSRSPLPIAALPSMSLFPKAPFDLSVCPSMSLDSRRLHCISAAPAALDRYPRGVTGHVAYPVRSIREQAI
jgi:hypothetical protein